MPRLRSSSSCRGTLFCFAVDRADGAVEVSGSVMSGLGRGCVKTLKASVGTQQENRSCGLGDSSMREQRSIRFHCCVPTAASNVFTQPRSDSEVVSYRCHVRSTPDEQTSSRSGSRSHQRCQDRTSGERLYGAGPQTKANQFLGGCTSECRATGRKILRRRLRYGRRGRVPDALTHPLRLSGRTSGHSESRCGRSYSCPRR